MLSELLLYILVGMLFLSTLIIPIGNYQHDNSKKMTFDKISESTKYAQAKSYTELSDYIVLANKDYIFILNSSIEDDEENIISEFKIDGRYFYNNLDKKYKDYKVIAEFKNGKKIYPKEVVK